MTVIASPGQGPDRSTEVSYTDTKVRQSFINLYIKKLKFMMHSYVYFLLFIFKYASVAVECSIKHSLNLLLRLIITK